MVYIEHWDINIVCYQVMILVVALMAPNVNCNNLIGG